MNDITDFLGNLCRYSGYSMSNGFYTDEQGRICYTIDIRNNGILLFRETVSDENQSDAKIKCEDRIMLSIFMSAMNNAETSLKQLQ